jgi:hypothetical protein
VIRIRLFKLHSVRLQTKLRKQEAQVIQSHKSVHVHNIRQGETRQRKYRDSSGTQRKGNVRRWKPLLEDWCRHSKLILQVRAEVNYRLCRNVRQNCRFECKRQVNPVSNTNSISIVILFINVIFTPWMFGTRANEALPTLPTNKFFSNLYGLCQPAPVTMLKLRTSTANGWDDETRDFSIKSAVALSCKWKQT